METEEYFDVLLPRYSVYLMQDEYRYNWTHEILDTEESKQFDVSRSRRISIITRVAPQNVESKIFDSFGTLEGKII